MASAMKKPAKKLTSSIATITSKTALATPVGKSSSKPGAKQNIDVISTDQTGVAGKTKSKKNAVVAGKEQSVIVDASSKKGLAKDLIPPKVIKVPEQQMVPTQTDAVKAGNRTKQEPKPAGKVVEVTGKETKGKNAKPSAQQAGELTSHRSGKQTGKNADTPQTAPLKASVTINKTDSKTVIKPTKSSAKADKTPEVQEIKTGSAPAVSQTTDAAVLAAIDTSGYVLPGVKVPGRRGRKPKEYQPENEEMAALNAVERAEMKAIDKAKAKDRKAKEKALLKDAFSADPETTEEELERRRQKLKTLIKLWCP